MSVRKGIDFKLFLIRKVVLLNSPAIDQPTADHLLTNLLNNQLAQRPPIHQLTDPIITDANDMNLFQ